MSAITRKFVILATGSFLALGALAMTADARGGGHGGHGHGGHHGGHAHHAHRAVHHGARGHVAPRGVRTGAYGRGRAAWGGGWWGDWGPSYYAAGSSVYVPPATTVAPRTIIIPNAGQ